MAVSSYISMDQTEKLLKAIWYADAIGRPLTEMLSINLSMAGVTEPPKQQYRNNRSAHTWITDFLDLAGEWLSHPGRDGGRHYVYVLENPSTPEWQLGKLNLHILIHIPFRFEREFRLQLRRWAKSVSPKSASGPRPWKKVVHSKHIDVILDATAYVLKGASPTVCGDLKIKHRHQGRIVGKRVGWSQSLGVATRTRAPVQPPFREASYELRDDHYRARSKYVKQRLYEASVGKYLYRLEHKADYKEGMPFPKWY